MDTLTALAHRVVMASFHGRTAPPWILERLAQGLGSVCVFGSNVDSDHQVQELLGTLREAAPDVLVAIDEEGGDVTRLDVQAGSLSPGNATLGVVDDEQLTAAVAAALGSRLAGVGVDLDLAPVVDVNSNPDNPVIGVRSFGSDPGRVARHARAFVEGLQRAGVGACAKHFPGHGDTSVDSHLDLPSLAVSREELGARELVPFRAAVDAGAVAVMTSHVLIASVDLRLPATLSKPVLDILRTELGFDGLIVADALDMAGACAARGEAAAAVLAVGAGCDLLCLGADKDEALVSAVVGALVGAVRSGELAEERLADAARRVGVARRQVQGLRASAHGSSPDGGAGRVAAERAIRVTGNLPDLRSAVILRFTADPSIAVGQVPWGLPAHGALLAGRAPVEVTEGMSMDDLVPLCSGRPVLALVRGPHRRAWVLRRLAALAERCPDLVTVEMGWPGDDPLPGVAVVRTYGASRAAGDALDALLSRSAAATVR